MSFLDSFTSFFSKKLNPAIFDYFNARSIPRMGEKDQAKAYRGWVYACVNAIAGPISTMQIKLEKNSTKGWQPVETHPALDILHNVNDFYTYDDIWFWTEAMIELNGNAFWYMVSDGNQPSEIWPLDPLRVQIIKDKQNFIGGYIFTNEIGGKVNLEPSEVLHFKTFNPLDPYRGMSIVRASDLAIDTDQFAAEWQRNFFGNAAMPSALLTSDGKLSQEQYNRIRANWDTKFKGVANAHKLAILEGGMTFTAISPNAKEMQFTESRKNTRDEILAAFRVPKVVLGITEDVNLASAEASEYSFTKFVIKPKMQFLVGKLNEFYLPLFGLDMKQYRFTVADPVPENIDQKRLDRDSGVKNYYMTPNEARALMTPPLPPLPDGNQLMVPTIVAPLGSDTQDQGQSQGKSKKKISKQAVEQKRLTTTRKRSKVRAYTQGAIKNLHTKFNSLNEDLKSMLLKNLMEKSAHRAIGKGRMRWKKDEAANDLIHILFQNFSDWVGLVLGATKEGMTKILNDSGKSALAEVAIDVDFDMTNPRVMQWLGEHVMENATSYTDTMKEDIGFIITQSIEAGRSVDQLATDLGQFFDEESDWRAERLARTETIEAYNAGNLEGYRQSGVVEMKEWLTGGDNASCDDCQANEDQGPIALDEDFQSGDDAPTAHPNCECSLQPVTTDDLTGEEE